MDTSTPASAREHARAQAGATAETMATIPPPAGTLWEETLPGGGYASRVLSRGSRLRLVDLDGGACVQLWVYRADNPVERLCVADTTKVQWNAYLGTGALLLSDMGRVLMSITGDTAGVHDALCGHSLADARPRLLLALTRHGLGRADVMANVNLFTGARVADDGGLTMTAGSPAGSAVELRADMDVLVVVTVTRHPLDGEPGLPTARVGVTARPGMPAGPDDECRARGPEAGRAFDNTEEVLLR